MERTLSLKLSTKRWEKKRGKKYKPGWNRELPVVRGIEEKNKIIEVKKKPERGGERNNEMKQGVKERSKQMREAKKRSQHILFL